MYAIPGRLALLRHDVVGLEDTMHDRDVGAGDFVHGDIARVVALGRGVRKEEEVATVEGRLHRAAMWR